MSEQESESSSGTESVGEEGLEGLQEAQLDSVQGGGNPRQPVMDLQDSRPDTFEKSNDSKQQETKEESRDERAGGEDD